MKQMFKKQAAMLTLLALGIVSSIHGSPLAFKIENDQAVVVGCNSKFEGELIIPGKFQGKPVTAIGKNAFWRCRELTSVNHPQWRQLHRRKGLRTL